MPSFPLNPALGPSHSPNSIPSIPSSNPYAGVTEREIPYTIGERDVMQELCRAVADYARTNNEKTDAIVRRTEAIEKKIGLLEQGLQEQDKKSVRWVGMGVGVSTTAAVLWVMVQIAMWVTNLLKHK